MDWLTGKAHRQLSQRKAIPPSNPQTLLASWCCSEQLHNLYLLRHRLRDSWGFFRFADAPPTRLAIRPSLLSRRTFCSSTSARTS